MENVGLYHLVKTSLGGDAYGGIIRDANGKKIKTDVKFKGYLEIMKRVIAICMVVFALLAVLPYATLAKDPNDGNSVVKPTIVKLADDNFVITFSGEVEDKRSAAQKLDSDLAELSASMGGGFVIRGGSDYLEDAKEASFGNSYVRGWVGTGISWGSYSVSAYGSSSSAWFGSSPSSNCDYIQVYHTVSNAAGSWSSVPGGWYNNGVTAQGYYYQEDTWYLGTSWSGLSGSYGIIGSAIGHNSSSVFSFEGSGSAYVYPRVSKYVAN